MMCTHPVGREGKKDKTRFSRVNVEGVEAPKPGLHQKSRSAEPEKDRRGFASVRDAQMAKGGSTRYHTYAYTPQKPDTKSRRGSARDTRKLKDTMGFRGGCHTRENIVSGFKKQDGGDDFITITTATVGGWKRLCNMGRVKRARDLICG